MTDETLLDANEPAGLAKRPVFLTVLCILTWVGSGLQLFLSWSQYDSAIQLKEQLRQHMEALLHSSSAGYPWTELNEFYEQMILHALIQATACLCCIVGAVFVWRLRRFGFYLYAFGELASAIAFGWMMLNTIDPRFGALEMLTYALMTFFSIVLLVLYILNLKHLRR